jgi:hypothetical protein
MAKVIIMGGIIAIVAIILVVFKPNKHGKSIADNLAKRFADWASNTVDCLYFADIVEWLKARQKLKAQNPDNIAFSLLKRHGDGKIEVVAGIFNTKTDDLLDGIKYTADRVDPELENAHKDKELVLYE